MNSLEKEMGHSLNRELKPRVTIITVVFNGASTLIDAINSIRNQTYRNIEFIVIDGASTDGTVEIIREHAQVIDHWVSEPDKGIFDAMNKGLDLATGDWIYFLGADDQLFDPDVLNDVFRNCRTDSLIKIGRVIYDTGAIYSSTVNFKMNIANKLHHQSAFYHSSLFKTFRYDTRYPVVSDYELNYAAYRKGFKIEFVDSTIAICGSQGVSKTRREFTNYTDYFSIRAKYIGKIPNMAFFIVGIANLSIKSLHTRIAARR